MFAIKPDNTWTSVLDSLLSIFHSRICLCNLVKAVLLSIDRAVHFARDTGQQGGVREGSGCRWRQGAPFSFPECVGVGDGVYGVEEVVGDGRSYYGHILDSPIKTRPFTILFPPAFACQDITNTGVIVTDGCGRQHALPLICMGDRDPHGLIKGLCWATTSLFIEKGCCGACVHILRGFCALPEWSAC